MIRRLTRIAGLPLAVTLDRFRLARATAVPHRNPASNRPENGGNGAAPRKNPDHLRRGSQRLASSHGRRPAEMLQVNKNKGTGTDTVAATPVDWWSVTRPPGTYTQTLVFSLVNAPQTKQVVTVKLTIIPKLPDPKFTYLAGPTGCSAVAGILTLPPAPSR